MGTSESKLSKKRAKLGFNSKSLPNLEINANNQSSLGKNWELSSRNDLSPTYNSPSEAVGVSKQRIIKTKSKRIFYASDLTLNHESDPNIQKTDLKKNSQPTWSGKLPVCGQGVVVFDIIRNTPFSIVVKRESCNDWISLDIDEDSASFTKKQNGVAKTLISVQHENAGYQRDTNVSYWISYDRDQLILKYGKGYMMEEAVLMEYSFIKHVTNKADEKKIRENMYDFFNPIHPRYVELFDVKIKENVYFKIYKKVIGLRAHSETCSGAGKMNTVSQVLSVKNKVHFNKTPLLTNRPCYVLDSSKLSLYQLDRGSYMFSSSLPPAAKELFENIKTCKLDWKDDDEAHGSIVLSDAIRYSIETSGCLLNNKLKEKATSFGKNPKEKQTYLRITLGQSFGKSPGIPYVLEIWPSKHYSPIHNHGNASAIIKVLFGKIHARIFNKFTKTIDGKENQPKLLKEFDAVDGDITWMDRNWYQTHQLENMSDDFCATIQCYGYDDSDNSHWPYFDYLNDTSSIAEFLPNTDFTFTQMCEIIKQEYKTSLNRGLG